VSVLPLPHPTDVRHRDAAIVVADGRHALEGAAAAIAHAGFSVIAFPSPHDPDPALIVLVVDRPVAERVDLVAESVAEHPTVPVVVSMPADATGTQLRKALRAGAAGIVLDDDLARTLGPTAQAVHAGQLAMPPVLGRRIAPQPLSHREKEVLGLVVRGYTNRQIADELYLAESTVKTHLSSAFAKLDTRSRAEAAALILDPEEGHGLGILPTAAEDPLSGAR
jgi:DNA-binding NarL/FixJ family response regulator